MSLLLGVFIDVTLDYAQEGCFRFVGDEKKVSYELVLSGEEADFHFAYPDRGVGAKPRPLMGERRVVEGGAPREIGLEDLKTLCEKRSVAFYTGAGISAAAGIPTLHELLADFGLKGRSGENFLVSMGQIISAPRSTLEKVKAFQEKCERAQPTKAHVALVDLIERFKAPLITENVDDLHEKSGLSPLRPPAEFELSCDVLICVGLSFDEHGLLGLYKKQNPEGIIVSIDLAYPSYLGHNDYLIKEDCQLLLPAFAK